MKPGLDGYNETIRRVAREEGAPLCDLAASFPPETRLYTDFIHHTDAGDQVLAELVAAAIAREGLIR